MSATVAGVLSGLIVVFLGWLARTIFLSRRLFLIQPKLFDYSDLINQTDSKTVEITVVNSGARSEEEISVQFSPLFKYTVLATSMPGLMIDNHGLLKIDRLSPKQDATIIFSAEGGEFRKDHVVKITSKDSVGKIKESVSEARLTPLDNLVIPLIIFGLMPAIGYFGGNLVVDEIWPEIRGDVSSSADSEKKKLEFVVSNETSDILSSSKSLARSYQDSFKVVGATRTGGLVTLVVEATNPTSKRLEYTLITNSAVNERRDEYKGAVGYVTSALLFPKTTKTIAVEEYLPLDAKPQLVVLDVTIDGPDGRSTFSSDISFEN